MNTKRTLMAGAIAGVTLISQAALAASEHALEEVLVTAQKRAQNMQDVGISVTAFTGEQLKDLGINQPVDVAAQTPGLDIKNTVGNSNPVITIRGIGMNDYNTNNAPSAAVHVDDIYLGSNGYMSFQLFDIARVEVLKGPQGTLYGRNTTAGSVNFISNKPSEEFEASVDLSYGNFNSFESEAAIGGALTDNLQGRLAIMTKNSDGHLRNRGTVGTSAGFTDDPAIPAIPSVGASDFGGADAQAWRASLAWQPSDDIDVLLNAHGSRDQSEQWIYKMDVGDIFGTPTVGDEYTVFSDEKPEIDADQSGTSVKVDWNLGFATLTSISGIEELDRTQGDGDGSPFRIVSAVYSDDLNQFTQELRLTSNSDSDFFWVLGAFYMEDEVDFSKQLNLLDLLYDTVTIDYTQKGDSWATFGQGEWQFNEAMKLTVGLRYTEEDKNINGVTNPDDPYGVGFASAVFGDAPPITYDNDYETDDISGKIALDWTPSEDLLIYGSISKGFKSGGFDGSTILSISSTQPFLEETLIAYEAGFKSTLLDGTLQLNGSVYRYDFEDMQVQVTVALPGGLSDSIRSNAGEAEITGAELELWWRPAAGWDIKAGVAVLDGEITKWDSVDPDEVEAFEGNSVPDAPETTFNTLIRYEWALDNGMSMSASTDFNYSDKIFKDVDNSEAFVAESYFLVNGRLSLSSADDTWSVALWGKNLADEQHVTQGLDIFGPVALTYNMPRTYGMSLSYNW